MSSQKIDPRLSFLAGWWIGRRRRRSGAGCLLLGLGLVLGMSACFSIFSAPLLWMQTRDLSSLPQPSPEELPKLAPGTHALLVAQLPRDLPVDEYGLALSMVEARSDSPSSTGAGNDPPPSPSGYQVIEPPPGHVGMLLTDGAPIVVQLPQSPSFLNAQRFEEESADGARDADQLRRVGYTPGQVLTLLGAWEGDNLFTASELYAGSPADYLDELSDRSGASIFFGLLCAGLAVLMIAGGLTARFLTG